MKGCRPLTQNELDQINEYYQKRINSDYDKNDLLSRNKAIVFIGCYLGLRCSELMSIKIKDIYQYDKICDSVYIKKSSTKGKISGRNLPINDNCKEYINEYIKHYNLDKADPDRYLFFSRKGNNLKLRQVEKILSDLFFELKIGGKVSTHSLRKTFAKNVYQALDNDILSLSNALGHKNLSSTQSYIAFDNAKINNVLDKLNF